MSAKMEAMASVLVLCASASIEAAKISVDRERMTNLKAAGEVWNLFDEQDLAGDPKTAKGGTPITQYTSGWVNAVLNYPIEGVVDLGAVHDLTDVWYYDINGSDSIDVSCGDGRIWKAMLSQNTTAYMAWVGKAAPCTGRYVKIRLKSPSAAVTEMVLYGAATGATEPLPVPVAHRKPTMGELMGINGFIDDDRELLQVVGNLREYHSWQWDDGNDDPGSPAYPNNRFGWNPSAVRGTGWAWNFDDYYGALSAKGIDIQPVFQGSTGWMFGKTVGDSLKPFPVGRDSSSPASYVEHADYLYQFAARFGRTKVGASDVRVDASNTAKTGLGFVRWMENWNEPDKDWKGRTGYFSPAVLSAMSSADYDGDQGRMGAKVGVKNADPSMKMALAGLIGIKTEYVKAMKFWSDMNRAGSFPADALNFHHYCTDGGGQGSVATTGISPEQDDLLGRLREMARWRDRFLPGKELWLSEFGWDTHPGSVFRAHAVGSNDELEMQARWLVRAFMALAASGFDKGHVFMLRDTWDSSPGTFATSGLVHDKYDTLSAKYARKPSWYYVNTLHKTLGNFRFEADESTDGMRVYRFSHASDPDSVGWVVWNPSDSAPASAVEIRSGIPSGRVVRFADGEAFGKIASVVSESGRLVVDAVDGRPVIVVGKMVSSGLATTTKTRASIAKKVDGFRIDGRRIPMATDRGPALDLQPIFVR